jgi:hypothetical protein
VLDSARFLLADEFDVSVEVTAFVLGGHGDRWCRSSAIPPCRHSAA